MNRGSSPDVTPVRQLSTCVEQTRGVLKFENSQKASPPPHLLKRSCPAVSQMAHVYSTRSSMAQREALERGEDGEDREDGDEEEEDEEEETCTDGDESDPGTGRGTGWCGRGRAAPCLLLTCYAAAEWQAPPQVEERRRGPARYGKKGRAPPRAAGSGSALERLGDRWAIAARWRLRSA